MTAKVTLLTVSVAAILVAAWYVGRADGRHCDPYAASSIVAALGGNGQMTIAAPAVSRGCR